MRGYLASCPTEGHTSLSKRVSAPPPLPQFPGEDRLFCRYAYSYGPDWQIVEVRAGAERAASAASAPPPPPLPTRARARTRSL